MNMWDTCWTYWLVHSSLIRVNYPWFIEKCQASSCHNIWIARLCGHVDSTVKWSGQQNKQTKEFTSFFNWPGTVVSGSTNKRNILSWVISPGYIWKLHFRSFEFQKYPGRHCMPSALPSTSCLCQSVTPTPQWEVHSMVPEWVAFVVPTFAQDCYPATSLWPQFISLHVCSVLLFPSGLHSKAVTQCSSLSSLNLWPM